MGETSTHVESGTRSTPEGQNTKLESTIGISDPLETSHTSDTSYMQPVRVSGNSTITVRVNGSLIGRQRAIKETNAAIRRRSRG